MNHQRSKRKNKNRKKSPKSKSPKSKSPPKKLNEDELVNSLMKAFSSVWFESSGSTVASEFSDIGSSVKQLSAASSSRSGSSKAYSFGVAPLRKDYSTRKGKVKCEDDAGSVLESNIHFGDSPERSCNQFGDSPQRSWSSFGDSPERSCNQFGDSPQRSWSSVLVASPSPTRASVSVTPQSVSESLFNTPKPDRLKIFAEKYGGKSVQDKPFVHGKGERQSQSQSQMIFQKRNTKIYNVLTLDLHGLQLKPALERVKSVLSVSAYLAVQELLAITGRGLHSKGNPVIKDAVIALLEKEGIRYIKENEGAVRFYLDGRTDFSSLETDSV